MPKTNATQPDTQSTPVVSKNASPPGKLKEKKVEKCPWDTLSIVLIVVGVIGLAVAATGAAGMMGQISTLSQVASMSLLIAGGAAGILFLSVGIIKQIKACCSKEVKTTQDPSTTPLPGTTKPDNTNNTNNTSSWVESALPIQAPPSLLPNQADPLKIWSDVNALAPFGKYLTRYHFTYKHALRFEHNKDSYSIWINPQGYIVIQPFKLWETSDTTKKLGIGRENNKPTYCYDNKVVDTLNSSLQAVVAAAYIACQKEIEQANNKTIPLSENETKLVRALMALGSPKSLLFKENNVEYQAWYDQFEKKIHFKERNRITQPLLDLEVNENGEVRAIFYKKNYVSSLDNKMKSLLLAAFLNLPENLKESK